MSQNKEIPLSRCRSSAAVNLQQKEKGGISTILCLSCCSKEWIDLSTKYAHYPFYARGNLAIRWHDLLSIKSLYRLARVHFPDAAHQHHPVKGWPASPASLLQPRPSPRTMVHLPGGLPTVGCPPNKPTKSCILLLLWVIPKIYKRKRLTYFSYSWEHLSYGENGKGSAQF